MADPPLLDGAEKLSVARPGPWVMLLNTGALGVVAPVAVVLLKLPLTPPIVRVVVTVVLALAALPWRTQMV